MSNYNIRNIPFQNPAWDLSLLEIHALLGNAVEEVNSDTRFYAGKKPLASLRADFESRCLAIKDSIPVENYLSRGQVSCEGSSSRWIVTPDDVIYGDIAIGAAMLTPFTASHPVAAFSESIAKNVEWRRKLQVKTAEYLCGLQERYLFTGDARYLHPISANAVSKVIGVEKSSFARLNNGFTMSVNGSVPARVVFARELIPSLYPEKNSLNLILRELMEDENVYFAQTWRKSSRAICEIIREKYGVNYSERTVSKHKATLSHRNLRTLFIDSKSTSSR